MKLLITAFTLAPERNGVAEVVTAQAAGLAARGHDVTVATTFNDTRSNADVPNVAVAQFHFEHQTRRTSKASEELRRYRSFVVQFQGDFILSHCWRAWSTDFALPVLSGNTARKIFVSHGYSAHRWFPQRGRGFGLGNWLRGLPYLRQTIRVLRVYDHIVFLSARVDWDRFFDHRLVTWLGRPDWSAIPNGTYPERFQKHGSSFREGLGVTNFFILCVSAYLPDKNQELALRAFFRARLKDATLVFIGGEFNDYTKHLQKIAAASNPDPATLRVVFLEKQPKEVIWAAYAAADLFLLSSKCETQPLVILDAMAAGTPFLSTDVGCVSELPGGRVVHGERQMALELQRMQAYPTDRRSLGEEGVNACKRVYNWSSVLNSYETLLNTIRKTPR
jgi:glycosyltransferase involved in cell wall biosynthesis